MATRAWPRLLLLAALVAPGPAQACIWDSDTLDDEIRGLPEAYVLVVTDRWHRHGEAYYRHRLATLPRRLEAHPDDLAAYDDLAVAHERLGDRDAAVALMDRKLAVLETRPDAEHLYRAYANRGTFHAHAGRYDDALADLEKALALNPDAHFGRERYQVEVIRYVMAAERAPALWAESCFQCWSGTPCERGDHSRVSPFAPPPPTGARGPADVETAVAAMLRFGGREGAELYRTLGLGYRASRTLHLAWWAFHRALDRGHPAAPEIRSLLEEIHSHWREAGMLFPPSEADFAAMKENGATWRRHFDDAEAEAIGRGEDAANETVLRGLLAEADRRSPRPPSVGHLDIAALGGEHAKPWVVLAAVVVVIVAGSRFVAFDNRRRRLRSLAGTPAATPPPPPPATPA